MLLKQAKITKTEILASIVLAIAVGILSYFLNNPFNGILLVSAICMSIYLVIFKKRLLLSAIAFLIPISVGFTAPGTGAKLSIPSESLSLILFLAICIQFVIKNENRVRFKNGISILLLADFLWFIISSITSTHPEVSFKRLFIKAIFLLVFYFLPLQLFKTEKTRIKLILIYALGIIPIIFLTFWQHAMYDFNPRTVFAICQPYYNDHTIYGACLAFLLPVLGIVVFKNTYFFKRDYAKYFWIVVLLIISLAFLFALSRAAWLSVLVAMVFYILLRLGMRFKGFLILTVISVFCFFVLKDAFLSYAEKNDSVSNDGDIQNHVESVTNLKSDASNLERINRWNCAWQMFKDKPIVGFGPGTYQFEYSAYQTSEFKTYISTNHGDRGNAHSEYLSALSETGLIGGLIFATLIFYSIFIALKIWDHAQKYSQHKIKWEAMAVTLALITFYSHGLFNSFSDQDKMAFLLYGSLAVLSFYESHAKKTQL